MNAPTGKFPPEVNRIAVLRANALGDYIFALPALEALKARWPQAEITYIGKSWHKDFIEARPGPVDRVVAAPKCKGVPHETDRVENPEEVEAFFAAMRAEGFDLALQMHGGGGNSNPFVRRLGANLSVGLRADGAPALDINIPYVLYQNEVLRYLEVASAVGAPPVSVTPSLEATQDDKAALQAAAPGLRSPYVVLHPGASDLRRRWPAAKFGRLAEVLANSGYSVYVTGVAQETLLAEDVTRRARGNAENLCGTLSLPAMTALLSGADLVVSNDTGPLHLARALGTSTIGIYWFGNVINAGPMQMSGHRYAMAWTTHCPKCGMDCIRNDAHQPQEGCEHETSFVDSVTLETIVSFAEDLLESEMRVPTVVAL